MTAFIRQEAMEKAREIQLKADEEFAIEKSKLVREETSSIDSTYEKKFKQASMSQQITASTLANKTRLRVLGARQEVLDDLFEKAGEQVKKTPQDKSKYQGIIKGLILEGLYALNESKVAVKARKKDYDVVKKAIEEAQGTYKKEVGKDVNVQIDESDPLPDGSYVRSIPSEYECCANTNQIGRCFNRWWQWEDRNHQQLRRAAEDPRDGCLT